jgi:hypothetical protein
MKEHQRTGTGPCGYKGDSMTDRRNERDAERRKRKSAEEENERRREEWEERDRDLREAWRRHHPSEEEGGKGPGKRGRPA